MTLTEYHNAVAGFAYYPNIGQNVAYPTLGLAGEAGEVANKVKKAMREGRELTSAEKEAVADEVGDCLWYCAAIAAELGYTLEDVAMMNVAKLTERRKLRLKAA